jgi:hypothetical protein
LLIYQPGTRGRRTTFVQPGREFPASHFLDENGQPRMFSVVFLEGEATVDDQLGQYMLDKGIAFKSPILLPAGATA